MAEDQLFLIDSLQDENSSSTSDSIQKQDPPQLISVPITAASVFPPPPQTEPKSSSTTSNGNSMQVMTTNSIQNAHLEIDLSQEDVPLGGNLLTDDDDDNDDDDDKNQQIKKQTNGNVKFEQPSHHQTSVVKHPRLKYVSSIFFYTCLCVSCVAIKGSGHYW